MTSPDFYSDLSPLEQTYWHKLADLFQLVDPQKPEKGCKALILKARKNTLAKVSALETELELIFQGAQERTLRRVALLGMCTLKKDGVYC